MNPKDVLRATVNRCIAEGSPIVVEQRALSADAQFFFDHAGYSYDTQKETPMQGRMRCAESLAAAENVYLLAHKLADVDIEWEPDPEQENGEEIAYIWHRDEDGHIEYLASLGMIDGADSDYRRVIRAELASECLSRLQELAA